MNLYVAQTYVSVFIMCMFSHLYTIILSPVLCEWLLYCAYFIFVLQLYVAQYYVSGYYTLYLSSLWYSYE
jgi:hypothetical protein